MIDEEKTLIIQADRIFESLKSLGVKAMLLSVITTEGRQFTAVRGNLSLRDIYVLYKCIQEDLLKIAKRNLDRLAAAERGEGA